VDDVVAVEEGEAACDVFEDVPEEKLGNGLFQVVQVV
jgi:hypothetical protein